MTDRHIQTIEALAGFNSVKLGCQILGWIGAGVLGRHYQRNVPILCINGPTESGKSLLQGILHHDSINPDLGYRLNYDARQKLLKRSPGVTYVFTSDKDFDDLYSVKLVSSVRFQRIPSRADVLELIDWLKGLVGKCLIGSFVQAKTPEQEDEEAVYQGLKLVLAAVRSTGNLDLVFDLERHMHFVEPKWML